MLPTKEKSFLYQYDGKNLHIGNYDTCHPKDTYRVNQHLYFTSDEAIKEGDWFYVSGGIGLSIGIHQAAALDANSFNNKWCRKIVATTDVLPLYKAGIDVGLFLPQISQQFIADYCSTNGIDEVLLEYEWVGKEKKEKIWDSIQSDVYAPKLDSNNCVIIHSIKEVWSREEVEELLNNFSTFLQVRGFGTENERNWIKENLK